MGKVFLLHNIEDSFMLNFHFVRGQQIHFSLYIVVQILFLLLTTIDK